MAIKVALPLLGSARSFLLTMREFLIMLDLDIGLVTNLGKLFSLLAVLGSLQGCVILQKAPEPERQLPSQDLFRQQLERQQRSQEESFRQFQEQAGRMAEESQRQQAETLRQMLQ